MIVKNGDITVIKDYLISFSNRWGFGDIVIFLFTYWKTLLVGVVGIYLCIIIIRLIQRSRIKVIYFVRHGETILNAEHIRQGPEGGLSKNGIQQAKVLAERFTKRKVDVIYASPYERTQQTAKIVADAIQKEIIIVDLLAERRNPKEIIGKSYDDPEVIDIINRIDKSFHENGLRYSDEENFDDLKERAKQLLHFIEQREEKYLLMVSHGIFLKMVISYMLHRDKLIVGDYIKYSYYNNASNAGITVCRYIPSQRKSLTHGWEILAWDDYEQTK